MDWRVRISADPNVLVGKPVVKGTRISVELVLDLLAAGYTHTNKYANSTTTLQLKTFWRVSRTRVK